MANTRPFRNELAIAVFGGDPRLDRRKLAVLHEMADSTAAAAEEMAEDDMVVLAAYSRGVADVLSWLDGAPPSAALTALLELQEA